MKPLQDERKRKKQDGKVVLSLLLALYTHSLVSDQVMFNGGATIVLLDPVDLQTIAPVVDLDFNFGGTGFPYTRQTDALRLVDIYTLAASTPSSACASDLSSVLKCAWVFKVN